jgi:hypothetical protein
MRRCLAGMLFLLHCSSTFALTYSAWTAVDASYRRGYVLSYVEALSTFTHADKKDSGAWVKGYGDCVRGSSDQALVRTVDDYLERYPSAKNDSMIVAVHNAITELCRKHLPIRP